MHQNACCATVVEAGFSSFSPCGHAQLLVASPLSIVVSLKLKESCEGLWVCQWSLAGQYVVS